MAINPQRSPIELYANAITPDDAFEVVQDALDNGNAYITHSFTDADGNALHLTYDAVTKTVYEGHITCADESRIELDTEAATTAFNAFFNKVSISEALRAAKPPEALVQHPPVTETTGISPGLDQNRSQAQLDRLLELAGGMETFRYPVDETRQITSPKGDLPWKAPTQVQCGAVHSRK